MKAEEILRLVKAGSVAHIHTYTHFRKIDKKRVEKFERDGVFPLKDRGDGYQLKIGNSSSVYLFPGQIQVYVDPKPINGSRKLTKKEQITNTLLAIKPVSDAIRELKEINSGELYTRLKAHYTLDECQKLLNVLKGAGLIDVSESNMIRWIGK